MRKKNPRIEGCHPQDNGKREQRKNLLITLGVAVVIILAAACAFVFLTPSGGDKRGYGIRVLYRGV